MARDLDAFTAHFGRGINVAGQYSDNLADNGEQLAVLFADPLDVAIQLFTYDDAWYPSTDGGGYSLVIRDDTAPVESWNYAESWQAGFDQHGSPGRPDGDPAARAAGVMPPGEVDHRHLAVFYEGDVGRRAAHVQDEGIVQA